MVLKLDATLVSIVEEVEIRDDEPLRDDSKYQGHTTKKFEATSVEEKKAATKNYPHYSTQEQQQQKKSKYLNEL
jgi:hypothetical protein